MKSLLKRLGKTVAELSYDEERPIRTFFNKVFRFLYFSLSSFFANECYLKASLLTFYTLVSVVPIFAIVFSIAKGFGLAEFLQKQLLDTFQQQQDILSSAVRFAYSFLAHLESETIAGLGVLILFFSVFGLFENIERSLNQIWNIKTPRSFIKRSINYLAALIILPIILIASVSLTLFINAEIVKVIQAYPILRHISYYYHGLIKFAPYALMCVFFSFIYLCIPNTKIYFKPRIVVGIIIGIIFQLWQVLYIYFQLLISSYSAVYGSFAVIPLFLIWMQVNFVIFLFGGILAAQAENFKFLKKTAGVQKFTMITEKQLVLLILREVTIQFLHGEKPISSEQLSQQLGVSLFDVREALHLLEEEGLIAGFGKRGIEQYQLIVNPEIFTIQTICDKVDKNLIKSVISKESRALRQLSHAFLELEELISRSPANYNLKELALKSRA